MLRRPNVSFRLDPTLILGRNTNNADNDGWKVVGFTSKLL